MKRLKVLVIVKENSSELELMLTKEVSVITDTLEQSGFEAVVASASGQPMVTAATTLTSDLKLRCQSGRLRRCHYTVHDGSRGS